MLELNPKDAVLSETVELDPLAHEANFGFEAVLGVKSLIFISDEQANVEMYLFLQPVVFSKEFSNYEDHREDVDHYHGDWEAKVDNYTKDNSKDSHQNET